MAACVAQLLWLAAAGPDSAARAQPQSSPARVRPDPAGPPDGHDLMLRWLARARERSATENVYTGGEVHAAERAELESLPPDAPAGLRLRLSLAVGRDDLRLGNNRAAAERLLEAYELAEGRDTEVTFQLGLAHLRLGETQNCIRHRHPDSCVLPIRSGGIHREQAGARAAVRYLAEVLEREPGHLAARWLANMARW